MLLAALVYGWCGAAAQVMPTQATTVPLLLPGGLAYDAQGDLFFAETSNHVVRRVSATGVLTTVAGTGVQGFAGDGGPASAARLDSPAAVAIDAAGDIFIADSHNHRIRRVDAASGAIATVAGTGVAGESADGTAASAAQIDLPVALALDAQGDLYFADARRHVVRRVDATTGLLRTVAGNRTQGFAGDGGVATAAPIDTPTGLAVDGAGDLYLADTHNQRVRRVDAATGVITTVAGTGQPGFSGDQGPAIAAALRLPRGLVVDAAGNLFVADASNHRIRRIDAASGQMTTIAGDGTQRFAGDGSPAVTASLNSPRAVALSPAALPTLSDTGNARVRQVDAAAIIHTIAGLGTTTAGALELAAPNVVLYGTGTATATLEASPATGSITLFDNAGSGSLGSGTVTLGTVALSGNAASYSTGALAAGSHRLSATYSGDTLHSAAQSGVISMTITPAPLTATPASFDLLYGQPVPVLTGSLSGLLAQDAQAVALVLATTATPLARPAMYPVTATISGNAAGNYALTAMPATVTINKAPSVSTLTSSTLPAALAVHVVPTTSGVATGSVSLLDGTAPYGTAALSGTGDASFPAASLSAGTHTLTAVYAGDVDLLGSTSVPAIITVGPTATADFSLASTGQTAISVPAGSAAAFKFVASPMNGTLSSPILLTASGLPVGATASFSPTYLPPAGSATTFTLTIQTTKTARLERLLKGGWMVYAAMIPLLCFAGRRDRRRRVPALVGLLLAGFVVGCGNRIAPEGAGTSGARTYNITVIGTATSASGATLQHTAGVTLTIE